MSSHPVETYLKDLSEIYRTGGGVAEESYYGPLENLLNETGRKLKPRVRCVAQLRNTGAGEPDFGLYTTNQFQRSRDARPMEGQKPERGVIECKPWNDDSFARSESAQVSRYGKKYGLVLVTNYRDFVLIGHDERAKPIRLESFRMAEDENTFRAMLAQPHKAAQQHGERLVEYHIGGYQVIKKWLSYREKAILGRGLRVEEAEYVTEMARRIAALILMQPELDANYEAVKADTWPWPSQRTT
ncbi:MAG: hypothetical protein MUC88_07390 [Planctomycetes bacterium]|nr:hypothetical protein [Planctomycetota bacterium]